MMNIQHTKKMEIIVFMKTFIFGGAEISKEKIEEYDN